VNLTFHYGSLLTDHAHVFAPSDAKFVRRVGFDDLLAQAVDRLPQFRQHYASRSC
jgi:hypothetical protein